MKGKLGIYDKVIMIDDQSELLTVTQNGVKFYDENFNLTSTHFISSGYNSGVKLKNGKYVFTKSNGVYIYDEYLSLINSFTVPDDSISSWLTQRVSTDLFNNIYLIRNSNNSQNKVVVRKYDDVGNLISTRTSAFCHDISHTLNGYWIICGRNQLGNAFFEILNSDDQALRYISYTDPDQLTRFGGVSAQYNITTNSLNISLTSDQTENGLWNYEYYIYENVIMLRWNGGEPVLSPSSGRIFNKDGDTYICKNSLTPYENDMLKFDSLGNFVDRTSMGNYTRYLQEYNNRIFTIGGPQPDQSLLLKHNLTPSQIDSLQTPETIYDLKVLEPRWWGPLTPVITPALILYDSDGTIFYTQDGSAYQDSTTPHTSYNGLAYSPILKRCIATSTVGNSYSDDGGVTFIDTGEGNVSNQTGQMVWNDSTNEFFTLRGTDLYKSSDGLTWSLVNNTSNLINFLIYGAGKLWNASRPTDNELSVRFSTDGGVTWSSPHVWTQAGNRLRNVGWDPVNNKVLLTSNVGIYSSDGVTHTHVLTTYNTNGVTYNSNLGYFGAATTSNVAVSSPDGINWTAQSQPFTFRAHNFEIAGTGKIILSGFYTTDNLLIETTDGVNYTSGSFHKDMRVMGSVMAT